MMKWKKWMSAAMSAAIVATSVVVPGGAYEASAAVTRAAGTATVTDADLTDAQVEAPADYGVLPNEEQLHYMKTGLSAFCHLGPNTFHGVEWGQSYGTTPPSQLFTLSQDFDADTIVRNVKEAGFNRIMLTAKHHDGFCLWATKLTDYNISNTNYKGGKGDLLEELSDACTKYNLDMGCYLSPWDIHEDNYGCFGNTNNTPNSAGYTDYNDLYVDSIHEICTAVKKDENGNTITDENGNPVYKYGNNNPNRRSDRFVEWWMDGARGQSKIQDYAWARIIGEIKANNPNCQIFGTGGAAVHNLNGEEDRVLANTGGIHWIGNESGLAHDETWAKLRTGEDLTLDGSYCHGFPDGNQWSVPECDTKMLSGGWFWSSTKQNSLRSMQNLADIYFKSVGHGATLLLNLSPNDQGRVDDAQMNRLLEFGTAIKNTFDEDFTKEEGVTVAASSVWGNSRAYGPSKVIDQIPEGETYDNTYWAPAEGETTGTLEITFAEPKTFDVVSIEEYIQKGQTISSFSVEYKAENGLWKNFGSGATISSKRLVRRAAVTGRGIRIHINSAYSTPMITNVGVFKAEEAFETNEGAETGITLPGNLKSISIADAAITGSWSFQDNNTSAWTEQANASASFTFTGTKAYIKGTADPNHGNMDVYIDGIKVDTVNTHDTTRDMDHILYMTPDLSYGEHTVKVVRVSAAVGIREVLYHDGSGIFSFKKESYSMANGGTAELEVVRNCGSHGEVSIDFTTESGGAEQGVSYQHTEGTLTFAEGETSKKITIQGYENDRFRDGIDFFVSISGENTVSFGENTVAVVVIRDVNGPKVIEDAQTLLNECKAMNLDNYKNTETMSNLMKELEACINSGTVSNAEIFTVAQKLEAAREELQIRDSYSESDPFIMPTGEETKSVEAEYFTLDASGVVEANKYVRITERADASNGKEVNWFENGNRIFLPFNAPKAGTYLVKARYRTGRGSGNPNAFEWSGTNVTSGSLEVHNNGNAEEFKESTMEIEVTQTGAGTLVFTASSKAGPVIDKFEFSCKDTTVTNVPVTGITLNPTEAAINKGNKHILLMATIEPKNATNKNVTYSSSNEDVAVVDENGLVVGVASGEAVITATTEDGSFTAQCTVTVDLGELEEAQKTLAAAVASADAIVNAGKGDYTDDSWNALMAAYANAAKTSLSLEDMKKYAEELQKAIDGLKKQQPHDVITDDLSSAIGDAKKLNLSGYTAESAAAFTAALSEAQKILNNPSATQDQINAALKKLNDAKSALKPKTDIKPPVSGDNKTPDTPVKNGDTVTVGKFLYKVTNAEKKIVILVKIRNKKAKKAVIPAEVKIQDGSYKVTQISANAFNGCKSMKSIVIGKNIKVIGKKSFFGCKKLGKITLKGTKIPKIKNQAFKKGKANVKIYVPKKMQKKLKNLKKNLKKAGLSKKVVIKVSKK